MEPSQGVLRRAVGDWGVEARVESVVEVRRGVRWMWGFMREWAERMEERVRGRGWGGEVVDMFGW